MKVEVGSQPRVLHLVGQMRIGGIESMIMNYFRFMRERVQFDFALVTPTVGEVEPEILALGGRIFRMPHPRRNIFQFCAEFRRVLHERGPFVAVHSHGETFTGWAFRVAASEGIATRIMHSHFGREASRRRVLLLRIYDYAMGWLTNRYATHLCGCSRVACEAAFGGPECWKDPRVQVIPNALDLAPYHESATDPAAMRRELAIPENACVIGFVGRIAEDKNPGFALPVFQELRQHRNDLHLVFVGDGPLLADLKAEIHNRGLTDVHCVGLRSDIPNFMAAFDMLLMPSHREGLGCALIEAQAAGTPACVSTGVPREADLGLGLVSFIDLNSPLDVWVQESLRLLKGSSLRPSWDLRQQSFRTQGWDVGASAMELERLYLGEQTAFASRAKVSVNPGASILEPGSFVDGD